MNETKAAEQQAEERWVNLADVAEHLSVSQDTIRNWLKSGKIPTYKAGKQYKFRLSEIDSIIHCDVKPSNIYVTKWGGYKLGDSSASIKNGMHRNSDKIGTLKYMAPEVYTGRPFSFEIDTYSLGLILYELLRGEKTEPEDPTSKETALAKRLSGEPLPPIPEVDKSLQSIILKACSYNPEDRFSSPTEMLNELLKLGY